jgi:hypothetical protein
MNLTMNHPTRYAIRLPDGRCLGRFTITGAIVPVPPVFAHTFDDLEAANAHLEHARTALGFPDAELVPLAQCLRPSP